MTKLCLKCNKPIIRSPRANNVKYCAECRTEVYKYKEYRKQWQRDKIGKEGPDKIKCLICDKWYKKPVSHAYNTHGVDKRSYKEAFGLDVKKGITAEDTKEKLQRAVKDNFEVVVTRNLVTKGKQSRFTKGHKVNYKRSEQTKERLRKQGKWLASKYSIKS